MAEPSPSSQQNGATGRVISFWMRNDEVDVLEDAAERMGMNRNAMLRHLVREHATTE